MQTTPDCTSTCGSAKQLCCQNPISFTIHTNTIWQFLQRITPHQHRFAANLCSLAFIKTFGLETCCIAVLLANIVSGLSDDKYSAVPPAPATSRARLHDSNSCESLAPMPSALVPGVTAGLPPRFFVHCTRKSTCLGSVVQKKPGPPSSGRFSVFPRDTWFVRASLVQLCSPLSPRSAHSRVCPIRSKFVVQNPLPRSHHHGHLRANNTDCKQCHPPPTVSCHN